MSDKPLIGINTEYRPPREDAEALTWINAGYYESVTAAGGLPVLIPQLADDEDLKAFLQRLDGLVLCGCKFDLDPTRMGFQKHPATHVMPARREDFDRRLCKLAAEMKIPVLAIGSGMQTMNVVCGGTLFQHVTEDVPRALTHRDHVERTLRHVLDIVPGTRMDAIYGPGEIRVNSQHHMAVDQPAPQFMISARCPDGVVEAYESTDESWYCLGVQWHPENDTASALDMQVFQDFLEATRAPAPAILSFERKAAA
jgi:putative glutamine amidotransferase